MRIRGVFPPITTPFDRQEVDLTGLRRNARRWMRTKLAGLVALGSNGEAPFLDEEESYAVISVVREEVPRDRVLVAGTGRETTRATIAASERAAGAGADIALVRTPSFYKSRMTSEVFVKHYTAVADASPIPIILYNFTAVTGVSLPASVASELARHPNIVGMKESNPDLAQIAELVERTPENFSVLCGSAPTVYPSLCVGAAGAILALACVVPELCVRLYDLVQEGRHAEALALQRQLTPLGRLVTSDHGIPGLKVALDLAGYVGGDPRPPLLPPGAAAIEAIRDQLGILMELTVENAS
ncbi:MAG: dihydrodipicolinate synthase family protein [Acidobacteria bacterium]|nr:dihydrodipicolinate synthase family protein [Acidobacteriota bacterium]